MLRCGVLGCLIPTGNPRIPVGNHGELETLVGYGGEPLGRRIRVAWTVKGCANGQGLHEQAGVAQDRKGVTVTTETVTGVAETVTEVTETVTGVTTRFPFSFRTLSEAFPKPFPKPFPKAFRKPFCFGEDFSPNLTCFGAKSSPNLLRFGGRFSV